jgi:hypothetical protein
MESRAYLVRRDLTLKKELCKHESKALRRRSSFTPPAPA